MNRTIIVIIVVGLGLYPTEQKLFRVVLHKMYMHYMACGLLYVASEMDLAKSTNINFPKHGCLLQHC